MPSRFLTESEEGINQSRYDESHDTLVLNTYNVVAVVIFIVMALQFLFPSNRFLPLDRRYSCCARVLYLIRLFLY